MAPLRRKSELSKQQPVRLSPFFKLVRPVPNDDDITTTHHYPATTKDREIFINPKTKRRITEFHYKIYDLVAQIPKGRVTTYKVLSEKLGSHPRAVGQALRINPFQPLPIPCHRVVKSNLTIGGLLGASGDCQFVANKEAKLTQEGCHFDASHRLLSDATGKKVVFDEFT